MPQYIAKVPGYAGRYIEAGQKFDWDGKQGSWMEPVGGDSKPAKGRGHGGKQHEGGKIVEGAKGDDAPKAPADGGGSNEPQSPSNQDVLS